MRYWLYILLFSALVSSSAAAQGFGTVEGVPTLEDLAKGSSEPAVAEDMDKAVAESENITPEELNADDILAEIKRNEKQPPEEQPEVLSPQGLETENPEIAGDAENTVAPEAKEDEQTTEDEETVEEAEEEVQLDVFEPEFMNSLMKCQPDTADNEGRTLKIIGIIEDKCHITYGNYVLDLPPTILNNIHSFDDLHTVIKNSDFAKYDYSPNYTYEGVIYALDACSRQEEYMGIEEEEKLVDAVITRGLNSEYADGVCTIYLQNELDLDGNFYDYGVVCKLPQGEIDSLEPYFKDIVAKYAAPDAEQAEQPKEAQDADVALMYYMQKNGFCRQNKPEIK